MSFSTFLQRLIVTVLTAGILWTSSAFCAVTKVTFFPQSALVEESMDLLPQLQPDGRFDVTIILPPLADPESFRSFFPQTQDVRVDHITIRRVQPIDDAKITTLRNEIRILRNGRNDLQSKVFSIDGELQLWQSQTKAKAGSPGNADLLSKAIGKNIHRLHRDKFQTLSSIEELDKSIRELQKKLDEAAGKKETAWEVALSCSGSLQRAKKIHFSYILGGCGWTPRYRIEALPVENSIRFEWEADVWQSSGQDWKNVHITLATHQLPSRLEPPVQPSWIIRPRQISLLKKSLPRDMTMQAQVQAETHSESEQIAETPGFSYSSWSIGKKSLIAGAPLRVRVKTEDWKAHFTYVSRPSVSPQVFVEGRVEFSRVMDIPPGEASYLIDGAFAGKMTFSLAGREALVFFGPSPFLTVTTTILADQTGVGSVFQSRQTRRWHKRIEAANQSRGPAVIRIEEPAPQSRDERIKVTANHSRELSEKDVRSWIWLLEVAPGDHAAIDSVVDVEAPKDMDIDFGFLR